MSRINSLEALTLDLCQMYEDLRSGKIEPKDAIEANNAAGKIISASKIRIAYHALRGERPEIAFIGAAGGQQLIASAEGGQAASQARKPRQ